VNPDIGGLQTFLPETNKLTSGLGPDLCRKATLNVQASPLPATSRTTFTTILKGMED
jgi:hypothetical protein